MLEFRICPAPRREGRWAGPGSRVRSRAMPAPRVSRYRLRARVWSDDGAVLTGTRRRSASVCPSKPHPRILTTARANGTEVTASLSKDLLVAANGCAGHADPEPTPCSSHAISHGKRDVVCSRGMLPRLPPGSTARSARATPMLTGSTQRRKKV